MLISELNVKLPLPDSAAVALSKFAVDSVEAIIGTVVIILSVFPEPTVIPPLTVRVNAPEIVDVSLFAVVIDGNDLSTSISRVPPALIVMVFAVGIEDACTTLPLEIIV
jgi:hypothetical protein